MTLRLVLVSLVAALGLTVPGAPMIEGWVASTQNWMNARFADWDTRNVEDADYVIVSDYCDVGRIATRPAISLSSSDPKAPASSSTSGSESTSPRATLTDSNQPAFKPAGQSAKPLLVSFAPKTPVFEPIAIAETFEPSLAERLNRMNEGIGVVPPRIKLEKVVRSQIKPIVLAHQMYQEAGARLNRLNAGMRGLSGRVVKWLAVRRPIDPMRVFEDLYGGSKKKSAPPTQVAAAKPSAPTPTPAPRAEAPKAAPLLSFDSMETSPNLYFAGELSMPVENMASKANVPAAKSTAAPAKADAPAVATKPAAPAQPVAAAKPAVVASAPKPVQPKPAPAPVEKPAVKPVVPALSADDLELDVASVMPFDDGFGVFSEPAATTAAKAPEKSRPRFEPLEVGEVSYTGIAYELNRRNEGLDLPTTPANKVQTAKQAPAPTHSDLSTAVRLTREALHAWVNVLAGPTVAATSPARQRL